MKRAELVEKLDDLLIDYDQKATVPELQEILKKHMTKTEELAKGYTRFTVGELREMCNKKKLRVPATANKGCLIQALRYAEGGHSKEEISFGRYKGKTYEAIPMDYRLWAVEEVSKNETPAAALVRFATWAKRWMELEALEEEVIDPEEAAVVAPPKSTMDFKPTIRKKAMTSTTTAKRATPATSDSDGSWLQADPMDSETDADANKKILELWKRRRYWAVREGRAKQKAVAKFEKIGEPRESSGDLTVNEDNLDYDDDIEHRINSRRGRKVKNSTRKMIGSWTRKVWQAFLSTAVALAGPVMVEANEAVVEPIKDLYNATVMTSIIKDYHLLECNLDMCAYGLKGKSDGKLLKKPTKLLVSSEIYHHELARRCDKRHDHGQTAGANTAPSACYTWSFARAVVEATCKVDSSYVTAYVADAGEEDVGGDQQPEDDLVGASGIKLPKATSAATASALRRIHQNLGHPSNKDLTRHLRLCGATEEAIKGAQGLRCDTCQRLRRPGTQRPAKTVLPMDFNDEVAVDLFYLYDQGKVKHSILSVMDLASGYHVCRKIQSKLSEDLAESVRQLWLEWAGMPKRMVCDQERGFQKNFVDEMENRGIHVKYIAGQVQSMQKDLRQLLERIDDDGVDDEEIFHDASNLMEDGDAEAYRKQKRQWPDGVPRRRMRQKGPVPHAVEDDLRDGEDEYSPSVAPPDEEITGMDLVNAYVDKSEGDDIQDVDEAMWTTHKRTPKTIARQRDKEERMEDFYKAHGKEADFDINKGIVDQGVYSQLGHVLVMAHRNVLEGARLRRKRWQLWKALRTLWRSGQALQVLFDEVDSTKGALLDHDYEMDPHEIVCCLVNMVAECQEYLALIWTEECGWLVQTSTTLLWLSATAALMLTAESVWVFMFNKGSSHATWGNVFACLVLFALVLPAVYVLRQRSWEELEPPSGHGEELSLAQAVSSKIYLEEAEARRKRAILLRGNS
ncbi:unnamed protein product, partial [Effrenium voratum]